MTECNKVHLTFFSIILKHNFEIIDTKFYTSTPGELYYYHISQPKPSLGLQPNGYVQVER